MSLLQNFEGSISAIKGVKDSLFIACPSYEDRSVAVAERLSADYVVDRVVLFTSVEYSDKGKFPSHLQRNKHALEKACSLGLTTLNFCMDQPIRSMVEFEKLCRHWHELSRLESITVDVSTFPRQELIVLLRVLESLPHLPRIRLFYTEPGEYGTETPSGWLTRGVKSVRTVPGFGGIQQPGKKKLLIMFLGHEDERAAITWKRHQPETTITIFPDPNYRKELNGIVERTHQILFTKLASAKIYAPVAARGIEEAQNAVLELWEEYQKTHFLVVAPLGTKLQSLGVYRAAKLKRDIQITYAVPSVYNFNAYSEGVGTTWKIAWRDG